MIINPTKKSNQKTVKSRNNKIKFSSLKNNNIKSTSQSRNDADKIADSTYKI